MRIIKAQQGQNLFDIAIQTMGSVMGVLLIADENDLSITAELSPGQELRIPDRVFDDAVVLSFKKGRIKPATSLSAAEEIQTIHYAVASYAGYNYWE